MHVRTTLTSAGDPVAFSRIFRTLEPLMGDESYGLGGLRQVLKTRPEVCRRSLHVSYKMYWWHQICSLQQQHLEGVLWLQKAIYCTSNTCLLLHIICISAYNITKNAPMDSLFHSQHPIFGWLKLWPRYPGQAQIGATGGSQPRTEKGLNSLRSSRSLREHQWKRTQLK